MQKTKVRSYAAVFVIGLMFLAGCHRHRPKPAPSSPQPAPFPSAVAADRNGDRIVVGGFRDRIQIGATVLESAGGSDIFVARLSRNGSLVWVPQRYGAGGEEGATGVAVAPDGTVVIGGTFQGSFALGDHKLGPAGGPPNKHGVFVAKFSAAGNPLWATFVGTVDSNASVSVSVEPTGVIVAGIGLSGGFERDRHKIPALGEGVLAAELAADGNLIAAPMVLAAMTTCPHSACEIGGPLTKSCDPTGCVSIICTRKNGDCCNVGWTQECVDAVSDVTLCNKRCDGDLCKTTDNAMYIDASPPCTENLCAHDSHCCKHAWDTDCVADLLPYCGLTCAK